MLLQAHVHLVLDAHTLSLTHMVSTLKRSTECAKDIVHIGQCMRTSLVAAWLIDSSFQSLVLKRLAQSLSPSIICQV